MQAYVVGFALDDEASRRVALIRKNRPDWQAGKLNGIGGHVEGADHYPLSAMRREFEEETGVYVHDWNLFVRMEFPGAMIWFYRAQIDRSTMNSLRTTTDERVEVHQLGDILDQFAHDHEYAEDWDEHRCIPNLSWLLPLAAYSADNYEPIVVQATMAEVL